MEAKTAVTFRLDKFSLIRRNHKIVPIRFELHGVPFQATLLFKRNIKLELYMAIEIVCMESQFYVSDWVVPLCFSFKLKRNKEMEEIVRKAFFFEETNGFRRFETKFENSLLMSTLKGYTQNDLLEIFLEFEGDIPIGLLNKVVPNATIRIDNQATISVDTELLIANSSILKEICKRKLTHANRELEFSRSFFRLPTMTATFVDEEFKVMDLHEAFNIAYRLLTMTDFFRQYTDENVAAVLLVATSFEFQTVQSGALFYLIKYAQMNSEKKQIILGNLGYEQWKIFILRHASATETVTLHPDLAVTKQTFVRKLDSGESSSSVQQEMPPNKKIHLA